MAAVASKELKSRGSTIEKKIAAEGVEMKAKVF